MITEVPAQLASGQLITRQIFPSVLNLYITQLAEDLCVLVGHSFKLRQEVLNFTFESGIVGTSQWLQ